MGRGQPDPDDVEIGRRLTIAIEEAGLIKKEFAVAMGVKPSVLSRWLSGEQPMKGREISRAAVITGRETWWLMAEPAPANASSAGYRIEPEDEPAHRAFIAALREAKRQYAREAG